MELVPAIGLLLSGAMDVKSVIDSADAKGAADKAAAKQTADEQAMVDKANAQMASEESNKQGVINNTAALAAIRALRGQQQGEAGTVLTGPQGSGVATQGRTLLGG